MNNIYNIQDTIQQLHEERESFFTKGHINSYRRDRYDRWDDITLEIRRLSEITEANNG